jgi:hypothetical protein
VAQLYAGLPRGDLSIEASAKLEALRGHNSVILSLKAGGLKKGLANLWRKKKIIVIVHLDREQKTKWEILIKAQSGRHERHSHDRRTEAPGVE